MVGGHPENPVDAGFVGGGDVQRPVGAEHRGPQPAVAAVELRDDDLTREFALFGELEDTKRLRLERGHRESPFPLPPLGAVQENGPAGCQGGESRGPSGLAGRWELRQVGHGDAGLVGIVVEDQRAVVRDRVPAVVAPWRQQIDLVVVFRAVLHQPHLVRARAQS